MELSITAFAAVFFAFAAACGLALARAHVSGRPPRPSSTLVLLHGLGVASGMILLGASYVRKGGPTLLALALVAFTLAAFGGITMLVLHGRGRRLPHLFIAGHAALGLTGFGLLIAEMLRYQEALPPAE